MKLLSKMVDSTDWQSFVQRSLDVKCVGGGTLLHEAAKYGCIKDLDIGLQKFEATDMLSNLRPNDNGDTPLHLAAAYGHTEDVKVLLKRSSVHRGIHTEQQGVDSAPLRSKQQTSMPGNHFSVDQACSRGRSVGIDTGRTELRLQKHCSSPGLPEQLC